MLWGLTYDGENGARAVLEIFRKEIDLAFALTGTMIVIRVEFQYHTCVIL